MQPVRHWRALAALLGVLAGAPGMAVAADPALVATVISGSSAYSPERLFPVYKEQLGVAIDAQNIRKILANIESFYLRDGFYKPELVARPDASGTGILLIDVYEVRLTAVQIQGNAGPHAARLQEIAATLKAQSPLPGGAIPAAIRQMRALPGLSVTASTVRDEEVRNGLILKLAASYKAVAATVQWSDRGTSQIGPNFVSARVTLNSVLGGREQFGLLATSAFGYDEYHGLGGWLTLPVNDLGTSVLLSGYHSASSPATTGGERLDLRFPHDLANLRIIQKLGDHPYGSLAVFTGFDFDDSRIQYEGQPLESDRVRLALIGAALDGSVRNTASYSVASSLRRGITGLDAGVTVLDEDFLTRGYTVGTLNSTLALQVGGAWSVNLAASGQWTGNVLPYEERFKIGTEAVGRAFTTAVLAGDSGVGVQGQLHYRLPGVPSWAGAPSVFAYTDYGTVWEHDLSVQQYAVTSGAGVALQIPRVTGSVEVGKPVGFSAGLPHDFTLMGQLSVSF